MAKYDIYFAEFPYEEIDEVKPRPVLIMGDSVVKITASKITSTNKPYYYPIIKWREAGLKHKSYIQLDVQKDITENQLYFKIGHLSDIDIENIEKILSTLNKK